MPRRQSRATLRIKQNSVMQRATESPTRYAFSAEVLQYYPSRGTCDLIAGGSGLLKNVPINGWRGYDPEEQRAYGESRGPAVGDEVVVLPINGRGGNQFVILGSFYPYFLALRDGAINSDNKQFSTDVLADEDPKTERHIFRSGTSVEVQADGTMIVETPSGNYVRLAQSGDTEIRTNGVVNINDHLEIDPA